MPGERDVCSAVELSITTPRDKRAWYCAGGRSRTPGNRFWRPFRFRSSPTAKNHIVGTRNSEAARIGYPMGGSLT
jgi:hypothetical protein